MRWVVQCIHWRLQDIILSNVPVVRPTQELILTYTPHLLLVYSLSNTTHGRGAQKRARRRGEGQETREEREGDDEK